MDKDKNLYYVGLLVGLVYFPFAALFYILSKNCLMYKSNWLYRLLITLRHGDWYEYRLRKTVEYLNLSKDMSVLEVGCGAGKFSKRLLENGTDLKAIDINEKFICKLQKQNGHAFELGSVMDLCYRENTFDRVVMFDVLHHIPKYEKALSEIRRVLKPGGYAVIWDGSESAGEERLPPMIAKWMMRVFDGETNPVHLEMLKGFQIIEVEPYCYKLIK